MLREIIKTYVKNNMPYKYAKYIELQYTREYKKRKQLFYESPSKLIQYAFDAVVTSHKKLDLENPSTFHEKLNWLKLHWYDKRAVICSDKYLVRDYVKLKGLENILNDLYGVYDSIEEIKWSSLPEKFILKTTHDSGHNLICNDKKSFDRELAKRMLGWCLKIDHAYMSGEWPYHTNSPKIICERLLEDNELHEVVDYKLFCFNGQPEVFFVASDRIHHAKADFYDLGWNLQNYRWLYEPSNKKFPRPKTLDYMIECARILSDGFPFVRVDFYEISGKLYFGEMTFFHGGGVGYFDPEEYDILFGNKIILPPAQNPWHIIGLL